MSGAGKKSSEPANESLPLTNGSTQSNAEQTYVKQKPVPWQEPNPSTLDTNQTTKVDSCAIASPIATNSLKDMIVKRIARSDGFYLEAKVNGEKTVFTIDTGATKTIISERVYQSISPSCRPKLSKTTGLTEASGQPLSPLGTAEFTITLHGIQFKADIIVANVEDDGMFGHDLLSMGEARLLYDEHAMMFWGVHLPCIKVGSTPRIRKFAAADHSLSLQTVKRSLMSLSVDLLGMISRKPLLF